MNAPTTPTRPTFGGQPPRGPSAQAAAPAKAPIDFRSKIRRGQAQKPPRIFLYGVEKIGKSTAGLALPGHIFLCSEEGLVGPQFADTPSFPAATWEEAVGFLDWLESEQHEFHSVVIDTTDWLEPLCYDYLIRRDKANEKGVVLTSIEDYGYGKGYNLAAEEFRRLTAKLDRLRERGMTVLLLAHSTVRTFKNPTGDDFDRHEPKNQAKIGGLLKEWADVVLFAEFQVFTEKADKRAKKAKAIGGDVRVVHTTKSAGWDAGNRYGLPDEMEFDMGAILDAIRSGNGAGGESPEALVSEIQDLSAGLPDEKRVLIEQATKQAGADAAALARVLNKTRATVAKFQENNNG